MRLSGVIHGALHVWAEKMSVGRQRLEGSGALEKHEGICISFACRSADRLQDLGAASRTLSASGRVAFRVCGTRIVVARSTVTL